MISLLLPMVALIVPPAAPPEPFALKDGDRVVWLGGTFVEREQQYGYWESDLLAVNAGKSITIRNLGWSGDTVYGDSRAGFEDANKGFERLVSLTLELKPTVIFISYGSNEAFDGDAGLPKFEKGLTKLLDALKPAKAKIVFFTPYPVFHGSREYVKRKADLSKYSDAIRAVATRRSILAVDIEPEINRLFGGKAGGPPLSDNGMHFTEVGYKFTSFAFINSLYAGKHPGFVWRSFGYEPLRQAVIEKNELFFHRWRPQNETYLFGFRKHEQGKNAKDIVAFDPLIAEAEKAIAERLKAISITPNHP